VKNKLRELVGGGLSNSDLAQCERFNSHELPPRRLQTWLSALLPALFAALTVYLPTQAEAQPAPLLQAHAHNDYEHARPLVDALEHGFCSVEADIWLVDGKLLVAHDRDNVKPARTLQALYLDPLRERVKKNGGRVFPNGPEFTLLIDLKSNWQTTYPVLRAVLTKYEDMLTTFHDDEKKTNAVMVVVSGSRERKMFAGETVRYAAFDGELSDLEANSSSNFAPWISARWGSSFSWRGEGAIPDAEKQKLADIVKRAHEQGRRVRFWGAPDNRDFWQMLRAAHVDLINTDDLAGLQQFLSGK
jgi:glycerophosphoryl diester phosphodiesterase